jgi:hypothetical protein
VASDQYGEFSIPTTACCLGRICYNCADDPTSRNHDVSANPIDISLTIEQRQRLAALCQRTGRSPSELLDQLLGQEPLPASIANGQRAPRTLYEAFAEDGSIGLIQDGPADLSSNPKYMKGFGRSDG